MEIKTFEVSRIELDTVCRDLNEGIERLVLEATNKFGKNGDRFNVLFVLSKLRGGEYAKYNAEASPSEYVTVLD